MTLPLTTTQVLIERPDPDVDQYSDPVWTEIARVDGVVSIASGSGIRVGGDSSTLNSELHINPISGDVLQHHDRVTDLMSGEVWSVDWVRHRYELGLEYTKAGLTRSEGAADGA